MPKESSAKSESIIDIMEVKKMKKYIAKVCLLIFLSSDVCQNVVN